MAYPLTDAEPGRVVWLEWPDYLDWLAGRITHTADAFGNRIKLPPAWEPGQHMALIGPTGCAKTTHEVGVLGLRNYVLALDPKGEDETLGQSGYTRVKQLPRQGWRSWVGEDQKIWRSIQRDIDEGRPARVIVGGGARTDHEDIALQTLMREALVYSRHAGGWTLSVDEFELVSSQRMFKLGPLIERMLITARRDQTSVVTLFQAPAWVSKHATRQARLAVVWPQDRDMVKNIAMGMGRNWREVCEIIDQLPPFYTATIPRGLKSGPIIVTSAPKLNDGSKNRSQNGKQAGRPQDGPRGGPATDGRAARPAGR